MSVTVVAAIIRKNGRILITQRPDNVHLARLWEFPGGKVEAGESFDRALQREILEELGVSISVDNEFCIINYDYPTKSVRLHFYNCTIVEGEVRPLGVADLCWIEPQHLDQFEFPPADLELIAKLRNG
jgi:mutator protein MutT